MKKFFFSFLLILIVGSIDAQSFEKVTDFKYSHGGAGHGADNGYKFLHGNKNALISGWDMVSINGINSLSGLFLFDGKNYTPATVGDDKCCGEYQIDPRARVWGSVSTGPYRVVFGRYGYEKVTGHLLDTGFVAIAMGEDNTKFVKTNICYSSIYDSSNEIGMLLTGVALNATKVFLGGEASTVNGQSCPFAFIYDIVTNEIDTLGGRDVENGPNASVIQVFYNLDSSKIVCLTRPLRMEAHHIFYYDLKTKKWSKENEPAIVIPHSAWYHKKELYVSANFVDQSGGCESNNVYGPWAKQDKNGNWSFICLNNSTNETWSDANVNDAMELLPDSTLFLGMNNTSIFQDWNQTLYPVPFEGKEVYYDIYSIDSFGGITYGLSRRSLLKVVGQILPLTWTSFTAIPIKNQVELKWSVANVSNNDRFEVERSTDGQNFVRISTVMDNGASSYAYTDGNAGYGTLFYRIKQVDKDGKSSFSQTLMVKMTAENPPSKLMVFPNPANGGKVMLSDDAKLVQIYSVQGSLLKSVQDYRKNSSIDVSGLAQGLYFIKTDKGETLKVVIQK